MSANPFTLSFGKKPLQYISRLTETNQILESFCAEIPSNQIYMITGVRGSGKTVMMTNIAEAFVMSSFFKDEKESVIKVVIPSAIPAPKSALGIAIV